MVLDKVKKRMRFDAIKTDILRGKVKRAQMDHVVHVGLSSRRKERRQKARLLLKLAVEMGVPLSKQELNEIKHAQRSEIKALRLRAKWLTSIRGLRAKYSNFLKKREETPKKRVTGTEQRIAVA